MPDELASSFLEGYFRHHEQRLAQKNQELQAQQFAQNLSIAQQRLALEQQNTASEIGQRAGLLKNDQRRTDIMQQDADQKRTSDQDQTTHQLLGLLAGGAVKEAPGVNPLDPTTMQEPQQTFQFGGKQLQMVPPEEQAYKAIAIQRQKDLLEHQQAEQNYKDFAKSMGSNIDPEVDKRARAYFDGIKGDSINAIFGTQNPHDMGTDAGFMSNLDALSGSVVGALRKNPKLADDPDFMSKATPILKYQNDQIVKLKTAGTQFTAGVAAAKAKSLTQDKAKLAQNIGSVSMYSDPDTFNTRMMAAIASGEYSNEAVQSFIEDNAKLDKHVKVDFLTSLLNKPTTTTPPPNDIK